jgi:hypothetical protein
MTFPITTSVSPLTLRSCLSPPSTPVFKLIALSPSLSHQWHDGCVQKPELFIVSNPDDHFLKAQCSLCPSVRFNLLGNTLEEKKASARCLIFTSAKPTGMTDAKPRKSEGPARRWISTPLRTRNEADRVRVTGPTLIKFAGRGHTENRLYRLTLSAMLMPGHIGSHWVAQVIHCSGERI